MMTTKAELTDQSLDDARPHGWPDGKTAEGMFSNNDANHQDIQENIPRYHDSYQCYILAVVEGTAQR
jgi:hypothetical protein